MAHYFPYDLKLRLLADSRSFLANQKARNAIVGAENLLMGNMYQRHRWKNPPVRFGALQVGNVLSNGKTNRPGKYYWKGLLESLDIPLVVDF